MLLPLVLSAANSLGLASEYMAVTKGHHGEPPGSRAFWYKVILSIGLVLAGGVFAGSVFFSILLDSTSIIAPHLHAMFRLTLGLMGLDELHLRVLAASSDDPVERANAIKGVASFNPS